MIVRKKYPALDRPYMRTQFQGYGNGRQPKISNNSQMASERSLSRVKEIQFNAANQHTGTYDNVNTSRSQSNDQAGYFPNKAPEVSAFEIELWLFENLGGNRDSGNDVEYVDQNGDTQNVFVNNNGTLFTFYSSTEFKVMPIVTGDSYNLHRLVGQANIDAIFSNDPIVSFSAQEFYNAVAIADTEAEVAAIYAS